jgi:predicted regulator of Ras-like GTPase activity (Roadblock/LC7/MglB family)
MIANVLPQGMEETRIAAMSAAMITMGTKTSAELHRGELEQIFIKGKKGYVVIMQSGPHSVLLALTREEAKLGLVFLGMSRAADEIAKVLDSI